MQNILRITEYIKNYRNYNEAIQNLETSRHMAGQAHLLMQCCCAVPDPVRKISAELYFSAHY